MKRTIRWLFWNTVYALRGEPKELKALLKMMERCRSPWWKFKPSIYHNETGHQWQIHFSDESDYVRCGAIKADLHISQHSGEIVGLTIWDETLKSGAGK